MRVASGSRPNAASHPLRTSRRLLVAAVASAMVAVGVIGIGGVAAAPPTTSLETSAQYGARWLATQYGSEGFVPTAVDTPNISATLQNTLALATAGVEEDTFDLAMAWLQANAATVIDGGPTGDDPARLGYLLLLAEAAGVDPTSFGGLDLPALLLATEGDYEPGLFGGADPTYDGAFRQGIAIVGLLAGGGGAPATATTWLQDQQCDGSAPAAEGGWQAYRADLALPCAEPDPINYTGPDTNSTALAIWALAGADLLSAGDTDDALDFLERAQASDGGFPYVAGGSTDPNSTALVILAILAAGEDPAAGSWVDGTPSPQASLLSWQVGCDAAPADQGAFASPFSAGLPDPIATNQAVWGVAGNTFPLVGTTGFTTAAVPCLAPTTTTTSGGPTTSVAPTTSTTTPASPVAQPVSATPRLAG